MPAAGNQSRMVPAFTVIRSAKEEPGSVPAASPRLRRSHSAWPSGSASHASPEFPPFTEDSRTHRTRPVSARFEPVS